MRSGRSIELRGRTLALRQEVYVPAGSRLSVVGPGTLIGDDHSLIRAAGNNQRVELVNVTLVHCASPRRTERRKMGSVVYALGKSHVSLRGCHLTSQQGFGVWAVQKARVELSGGCVIHDCGRSGVVCFGQPTVQLRDSEIANAAMHGICARGGSRVALAGTRVVDCGVRAIYAYHNVSLELRNTSVTGTRDEYGAAVQVEALRAGDQCELLMDESCRLAGNRGAGLVVKGDVVVRDGGS